MMSANNVDIRSGLANATGQLAMHGVAVFCMAEFVKLQRGRCHIWWRTRAQPREAPPAHAMAALCNPPVSEHAGVRLTARL